MTSVDFLIRELNKARDGFEPRKATGSELFSFLICFDIFIFSNILSLIEQLI